MPTYEIGDVQTLTQTFMDVNGNPADPSTVSLLLQAPDGTQLGPYIVSGGQIVKVSTGVYSYALPITKAGIYTYRWSGVGNVNFVSESFLTVTPTILSGLRPSNSDLCLLGDVKAWLKINTTTDDILIQRLITAAGNYWLWYTGRGNQDGSPPTQSPFVTPLAYNELYDGNGNMQLFLRNWPIQTVSALTIYGQTISPSMDFNTPGYVISGDAKSLVLRGPGGLNGTPATFGSLGARYGGFGGWGRCGGFVNGMQNINVQYTAGFNGTPPDISQACIQMVATTYARRNWIDEKQKVQPELGTVVYRDWEIEPAVRSVMNYYKRRAIV